MRTTIELSAELRQKLSAEALARNMKGFSRIIAEALHDYFSKGNNQRHDVISELKGCLSQNEYKSEISRIKEGRGNWRA